MDKRDSLHLASAAVFGIGLCITGTVMLMGQARNPVPVELRIEAVCDPGYDMPMQLALAQGGGFGVQVGFSGCDAFQLYVTPRPDRWIDREDGSPTDVMAFGDFRITEHGWTANVPFDRNNGNSHAVYFSDGGQLVGGSRIYWAQITANHDTRFVGVDYDARLLIEAMTPERQDLLVNQPTHEFAPAAARSARLNHPYGDVTGSTPGFHGTREFIALTRDPFSVRGRELVLAFGSALLGLGLGVLLEGVLLQILRRWRWGR